MYSIAKQRANVKLAKHRKAMKEQRQLLENSLFPPGWSDPFKAPRSTQQERVLSAVGAAEHSTEQQLQKDVVAQQGPPKPTEPPGASRRVSQDTNAIDEEWVAPKRAIAGRLSRVRDTRDLAIKRADEFIMEMREIIEGGSGAESFFLRKQLACPTGRHALGAAFTNDEMIRMHVAFSQFQNADHEIHVDDLAQPLRFQGYVRVDPDVCVDLACETTPYSTLAFAEYVKFVDTFAAYEKEEMRKEFDSFDDDGSGCLSLDELRRVLSSLGITPLKETLNDAMAIVDFDKSGELDFDEFVHLMAIYRVTDGFSKKEIGELKDVFTRLAVEVKFKYWEIQPDRLFDAMVYIFGPQSNDLAQKFIVDQRFRDSREMDMQGLSFMEFIIWARKLREAEIDEYRKKFEEADEDASGLLGFEEIRDVISKLGYRPLRKLIKEVIEEVDYDRDNKLDFDEFVNLMQAFRRTDGFNAVEVNELSDAFHRFANVGAQNLDSIQLLDVMRYLGYVTNLDTVRRFLVAVDIDRSGSLNMPKFLRIMRMNREAELTEAHNCFIGKSDRDSRLPHGKLHAALNEIGYTLGDKMHEQLEQGISTLSDPESLDLMTSSIS
jgi:Ca2+-binding EF-hand superfamily protein